MQLAGATMSAWLEAIPGVIVGTIVGGLTGGLGFAIHNSYKSKPLVPIRRARQAQEILSFAPIWFDEYNQVMTNEFLLLQQYRHQSPDKFDQAGRLTDAFLASYNEWIKNPNTLSASQVKKAHQLWFHIMSKLTSFETEVLQSMNRNGEESSLAKHIKQSIHSINYQLECCCRQMQSLTVEKEMLEKRRAQWFRQQQHQQQQVHPQRDQYIPFPSQPKPSPRQSDQKENNNNVDAKKNTNNETTAASNVSLKSTTSGEIPDYLTS